MKESRKGKFDIKSDEGIFLGYSSKSKAYRCLNLSTHKVIESAHVKVDEFAEKTTNESNKEPEDYRRFIFIDTISDTSVNKRTVPAEPNLATELEIVPTESQESEAQTESTESQTITTEPELSEQEIELPEDNIANHSKGKEPVLAKYVRKHHTPDQIIGDKSEGTMTRSKLKGTCLLANFKPRCVKDSLDNESWIEAMNEEIEQIEKKKTWILVPRPNDKNVIGKK